MRVCVNFASTASVSQISELIREKIIYAESAHSAGVIRIFL